MSSSSMRRCIYDVDFSGGLQLPNQTLFVIVTRQHSGSHFVRSILDAHPMIRVGDELLNWRLSREGISCNAKLGVEKRALKGCTQEQVQKGNLLAFGINSFPSGDPKPKEFAACMQNKADGKNKYPKDKDTEGGLDGLLQNYRKFRALGFIFHLNQGSESLDHIHNWVARGVKVIFLHRRNEFARRFSSSNMRPNGTEPTASLEDRLRNNTQMGAMDQQATAVSVESIKLAMLRDKIQHQSQLDLYLSKNVSVLYAPYETLNAKHEQFATLFRFLGVPVTSSGSTLADRSSIPGKLWTAEVSGASKHHPLDPVDYIKNPEDILQSVLRMNETESTAYPSQNDVDPDGNLVLCKCMLYTDPGCDYGPVQEAQFGFRLPNLCGPAPVRMPNQRFSEYVRHSRSTQFKGNRAGKGRRYGGRMGGSGQLVRRARVP